MRLPETLQSAWLCMVRLSGEIRQTPQMQKRIDEAQRMGFEKIIVPHTSKTKKHKNVVEVKNLEQAIKEYN